MRLASMILFAMLIAVPAAGAQQRQQPGLPAILDDLAANSMSAEEIRQGDPPAQVEIVSLAGLRGAERQRLQDVLADTEDQAAEVRTAIAANEAYEGPLARREVDTHTVVAVTWRDGAVTFYVDETPYR